MTDIIHTFHGTKRKIKYGLFISRKVTRNPSKPDAVISDLFPIKNDANWKTEFELLNVSGLISGDNWQEASQHLAIIYFFDQNGIQLGTRQIFMNKVGRQTIKLSKILNSNILNAKTFAVFHQDTKKSLSLSGSYLAERGYTGYEYMSIGMKGYVHGNLDAVALSNNIIEPLGNIGVIYRKYTVQHQLVGPATYEFVFTNPTSKTVKITPELAWGTDDWIAHSSFKIPTLGTRSFTTKLNKEDNAKVRFDSRLYLGRPVVFRISNYSMDVFHG